MHAKELAILHGLGFFCAIHQKMYCYPSQKTLLRVLATHYGEQMARSTLNVHLTRLEEGGFFKRVRRHKRGVEGNILFQTTLYKLLFKAVKLLYLLKNGYDYLFRFFRVRFVGQHSKKEPNLFFGLGSLLGFKRKVTPLTRGSPTPSEVRNRSFKKKDPWLPPTYQTPEEYWKGKRF